jgi:hypothetical protein
MQIKIHSNPVFACPLKNTQDVATVFRIQKRSYNEFRGAVEYSRPTHFLEKGLKVPFLNRPERNRQTDPIQPSPSNLRDILLGLTSVIRV